MNFTLISLCLSLSHTFAIVTLHIFLFTSWYQSQIPWPPQLLQHQQATLALHLLVILLYLHNHHYFFFRIWQTWCLPNLTTATIFHGSTSWWLFWKLIFSNWAYWWLSLSTMSFSSWYSRTSNYVLLWIKSFRHGESEIKLCFLWSTQH